MKGTVSTPVIDHSLIIEQEEQGLVDVVMGRGF
jgi:hypothetical protein